MTTSEKAAAYDELAERADELGYACIGNALDATPHRLTEDDGFITIIPEV